MKKLSLAFALGTGLTLSFVGTAPSHAAAAKLIQTLDTPELTAAQFNSLFHAIDSAPVLASTYQFLGAPVSGTIRSQVFAGQGAAEGLYAYAYQLSVNNVTDELGEPVHVDSSSWQFNATPVGTDFAGTGGPTYAYVVKDGSIGGLLPPMASGDADIRIPAKLSWQPGQKIGTIRADYVDPMSQSQPLNAGADSATFIVLTKQPFTQEFVNLGSSNPTSGSFTAVYAATGGQIQPVPVPEPSTLLAWAGMGGALFVVRRVRNGRKA